MPRPSGRRMTMAERDVVTAAVISPADLRSALGDARRYEFERCCACLYAAASVKADAREGGLTEPRARLARGIKQQVQAAGVRHLTTFAHLTRLLRSTGEHLD